MELRSLRMSPVLGPDARLSGTPWENLGISEKQGGKGRLNPGKDLGLRPRLLRTAAQILEFQAPEEEMDTGVQGTGASGQSQQD